MPKIDKVPSIKRTSKGGWHLNFAVVNSHGLPLALEEAYYDPSQCNPTVVEKTQRWLIRYLQLLARDGQACDTRVAQQRWEQMNLVNPKYVFRNYLGQLAIDAATAGDFSVVQEMLETLRNPYHEQPNFEQWAEKRPAWAKHRPGCSMLSCSS